MHACGVCRATLSCRCRTGAGGRMRRSVPAIRPRPGPPRHHAAASKASRPASHTISSPSSEVASGSCAVPSTISGKRRRKRSSTRPASTESRARYPSHFGYALLNCLQDRVRRHVDHGMAGALHSPGAGTAMQSDAVHAGVRIAFRRTRWMVGRAGGPGGAAVPAQPEGPVRRRTESVFLGVAGVIAVEHAGCPRS